MKISLTNPFRRLLGQRRSLRQTWEHLKPEIKIVIAITQDESCRMTLRVTSIEERWRILFANSVAAALRLCGGRPCVILYDRQLPASDWRADFLWLQRSERPLFPILISATCGAPLREQVVNCGGYDVTRVPLEREHLVALIHGALSLAESIDRAEADRELMLHA